MIKETNINNLILGILIGIVSTFSIKSILKYIYKNKKDKIIKNIEDLIGNTPLIRINSLSDATGCEILYSNPGGSQKDRVALNMIKKAEEQGLIKPNEGYTIYEGTVGSTGISLSLLCLSKGYKCYIVAPDDQALEKYNTLERFGAIIEKVRPASFVDKKQFVNKAKELADKDDKGFFANQFENLANFEAHYNSTGPEIFYQTNGTGGSISGISKYLKEKIKKIKIFLVDPPGSGLFNKIKFNTFYSNFEKEGNKKRTQVDTITEGVGINRLTKNFNIGLFLGSSSSLNCVGCVKVARKLGPGHTIVTLLSDSGNRHITKFCQEIVLEGRFLPLFLNNVKNIVVLPKFLQTKSDGLNIKSHAIEIDDIDIDLTKYTEEKKDKKLE